MELEDIARAARAAREFEHRIGEAAFTLRVPTPHEAEIAAVRNATAPDGSRDAASLARTQRALLEGAVVGWHGLTVAVVLGADHPQATDALAHEPGAVPLVLDAEPAWARELFEALMQRVEQRNALRSTAAKNSSGASSGSDPAAMRPSSPTPASAD